jgi:hypothetical protein
VHLDWEAIVGSFGQKRANESTMMMSPLLEPSEAE